MDFETYRNKMHYEEKSSLGRFIHGYLFTIKNVGIKALITYPYNYICLWLLTRKK